MRKASIEFEKKESVKAAITKFNETKLKDFELTVQEFTVKEKVERKPREPREPRAKTDTRKTREEQKVLLDVDKGDRKYAAKRAPREEEKKVPQKAQSGGIYIGNLSYAVTDKAFADFVYGFGKI